MHVKYFNLSHYTVDCPYCHSRIDDKEIISQLRDAKNCNLEKIPNLYFRCPICNQDFLQKVIIERINNVIFIERGSV